MQRQWKKAPVAVLGLLVLAALFAASAACKKQPPAEPEVAKPAPPVETWVLHAPEGEGFEILTPVAFTRTDDKVATEAGDIAYVNYMAQPTPKYLYVLIHSDMPEALVAGQDVQKLLKDTGEAIVKQFSGYKEAEKAIALGEHPGLELSLTGQAQGTRFFVRARIYLVKNRLYQIYAMAEHGYEGAADYSKYLDSFKLK